MSPSAIDQTTYEEMWTALNLELRAIEAGGAGLPGALEELAARQRARNLVREDLGTLRRHRLDHPEDPTRFFGAQSNPSRALRFAGVGVDAPPAGTVPVNGGCFLCRENIRWQQRGMQLGYQVEVGASRYVALLNPFPIMPDSLVLASREHVPQGWADDQAAVEVPRIVGILGDLIGLAARLPRYVGFHNGVGAGASIPEHLHFHFFRRPSLETPFPLEIAAREAGLGAHGTIEEYPVTAVYWRGEPEEVAATAVGWVRSWVRCNEHRKPSLSANIISGYDPRRGLELFFVPRDKARSHSPELAGGIGGLEVLGEVPFCTPDEVRRLERGDVDYATIERILSTVGFA